MYKNLKAELSKNKITNRTVAKTLDVTEGTASLKINGKSIITLNEAFLLQELIEEKTGKFISIETLFKE